jgi:hypothetical protein
MWFNSHRPLYMLRHTALARLAFPKRDSLMAGSQKTVALPCCWIGGN